VANLFQQSFKRESNISHNASTSYLEMDLSHSIGAKRETASSNAGPSLLLAFRSQSQIVKSHMKILAMLSLNKFRAGNILK
jgi:hypothetical protein